jgi:diguanylate cyclase (GGDEF)-like protein
MKKLLSAILVTFGLASTARSQAPAPLTSLHAIHVLTNAQASQALPVAFQATVTYYRGDERTLFVQDGGNAIYVKPAVDVRLVPGDRVLIKGTTHESFRPFVAEGSVKVLSHGALPKPIPATFEDLIRARHDCMLVTVRGVVRSADFTMSSDVRNIFLQMRTEGGEVDVGIDSDSPSALRNMLDAEVEVTGAASGRFDGKMQQTGILLHVSSPANVKILKRAPANPWALPITPMDEILNGYRTSNQTPRIRVHGTITYDQPGMAVVLQNGAKSLWVMTQSIAPLRIGDEADATGFPDVHDGFLTLTNSEIQDSLVQAPVEPLSTTWKQLTSSKNLFDLVSMDGKVVAEVRGAAQDEYVLSSNGQLFSAIYKHAPISNIHPTPLPPMKQIPLGSMVHVTGICILESANPFDTQVPFNLLMRTYSDITVVAEPSWLSIENLIRLVSVLLLLVLAVSIWGWMMGLKARRQSAALTARIETEAATERHHAQLEVRRRRILEDINGSRPLAEVIEQIAGLVSFTLGGAPCWCEIAGGAQLGSKPAATEGLRIAAREIPARTGAPLGTAFAALGPEHGIGVVESEALWMGARLTALAIETRRLYTDLVHRSEFDLLTDIHNRFSLDRHLEACIASARETASIFGLIYVDLDEFKQVNDAYGHHIGDLYLQEVSLRMKRQLRTGDMLSRLGGDEFAALVSTVRSRADVEEIALRMERCFDDPYAVEGYILHGSASVGFAIYPEDGATRDSLLSTADAAMYVAKRMKQQMTADQPEPQVHPENSTSS